MAQVISPAATPNFGKVVRNHFPQLDETAYATRATEQFANSQKMSQSAATLQALLSGTMDKSIAAFTVKSATFGNRATATALAGQNILSAKTELNARAEAFEADLGALKVQAKSEGWDQATYDEGFHVLLDRAQSYADAIAVNFKQTDTSLKAQITEGVTPTVPATMLRPTPGAPSLELPPELVQQIQGMLNS